MTLLSKTKMSLLSVTALIVAMPQIATAQSSAPLSDLYACERVTDKDDQLACFRAETAKLRAADTSGEIVALEKESLEEIKQAEVKKAEVKKEKETKEKAQKERTLAIRSTKTYGANGYVRFTLENGEVWQQIEAGRVRLGKAETDTLVIKKAALGSFLARVNGKRPSFRVRQVK